MFIIRKETLVYNGALTKNAFDYKKSWAKDEHTPKNRLKKNSETCKTHN